MEKKRALVLISNDDGYQAKGIKVLVDMLSDMADILVCAPEEARSGFSCAFSATSPYAFNCGNVGRVWKCGHVTARPSTV